MKNVEVDNGLVQTVMNGTDRESEIAFSKLFEKYKTHMFFMMRPNIKNENVIEDIVMKSFTKAYTSIKKFKPQDGAFSTWLYTIATNLYIDHLRKTQREKTTFTLTENDFVDDDGQNVGFEIADTKNYAPDTLMEKKELYKAVREVVGAVQNDLTRTILIMRFFDEKSYEEISEELKKPLGTIKATLHRGKQLVRDELMKRKIKN